MSEDYWQSDVDRMLSHVDYSSRDALRTALESGADAARRGDLRSASAGLKPVHELYMELGGFYNYMSAKDDFSNVIRSMAALAPRGSAMHPDFKRFLDAAEDDQSAEAARFWYKSNQGRCSRCGRMQLVPVGHTRWGCGTCGTSTVTVR